MSDPIRRLQQPAESKPLDPHKTKLVVKKGDQVVAQFPADSPNAATRLEQLARDHSGVTVDYEPMSEDDPMLLGRQLFGGIRL